MMSPVSQVPGTVHAKRDLQRRLIGTSPCEHDPMSSTLPYLEGLRSPRGASDLVILAHGGSVQADRPARDWHSGLIRVLQFGDAAAKVAPDAAVALVRYRVRGWNGASADPARDLQQVIHQAPEQFNRLLLIGHSMGGRAVLRAASERRVAGVLALAPWVPPGEPLFSPGEAPVVLATGTDDGITPAGMIRQYVERARKASRGLGYFEIPGAGHRLLRHAKVVDHLIQSFVGHALGDGSELIASSISADPSRSPDSAPVQISRWSHITGTTDNLLSVLAWKGRRPRPML